MGPPETKLFLTSLFLSIDLNLSPRPLILLSNLFHLLYLFPFPVLISLELCPASPITCRLQFVQCWQCLCFHTVAAMILLWSYQICSFLKKRINFVFLKTRPGKHLLVWCPVSLYHCLPVSMIQQQWPPFSLLGLQCLLLTKGLCLWHSLCFPHYVSYSSDLSVAFLRRLSLTPLTRLKNAPSVRFHNT